MGLFMPAANNFPDYCRLRDKPAIDNVFSSRKRLNSTFFALRYQKNDLPFSRLGVIIGKRNVRLSVTRNRIRRVIREQFRVHPIRACRCDIVFVVYKQANNVPNHELHQCVSELLDTLVKRSE